MAGFREALQEQRWDDHRYYHHSRINQALHLVSAISFWEIALLVSKQRLRIGKSAAQLRLDLVGTVLSALGLGLIVYGILRAGTWGFVHPKQGAPEWLGLSPVIWLVLAGGVVLRIFMWWEIHRLRRIGGGRIQRMHAGVENDERVHLRAQVDIGARTRIARRVA